MTVSSSDNLVNGCVYCKCVYQDWQNPTATAAVPWSNMQILFYSLTCTPHPHIFSYSRREKAFLFSSKNDASFKLLFLFCQECLLMFHKLLLSATSILNSFLLERNFQRLSTARQTVFNNHVFLAFSMFPKKAGVSCWALTTHPSRKLSGLMTEFQDRCVWTGRSGATRRSVGTRTGPSALLPPRPFVCPFCNDTLSLLMSRICHSVPCPVDHMFPTECQSFILPVIHSPKNALLGIKIPPRPLPCSIVQKGHSLKQENGQIRKTFSNKGEFHKRNVTHGWNDDCGVSGR